MLFILAKMIVFIVMMTGGIAKFYGVEYIEQSFELLGFPSWLNEFVGVCEIAAALTIFHPSLTLVTIIGVIIILCGVLYYHMMYLPTIYAIPAFVGLVSALYVAVIEINRVSRQGSHFK